VCPGLGAAQAGGAQDETIRALRESWGPVLEVWEGSSAEAQIHFDGSSGGLATALSLYCLEQAGMSGVLHTGPDGNVPYRNTTRFSSSRREILATTGSRYAPASPCDGLHYIENASGPCAFVGKPCDVEGLRKAAGVRPHLARNIGVAIGIFCAGTPSTQGTLDLLTRCGVRPEEVEEVRYRGRGWPGRFAVRKKGQAGWTALASYEDAWGFLQQYRPMRCHLCPDGTAELADISCGDPWYRPIEQGEAGMSLVLVRSRRGRDIVRGAIAAGYVRLVQAGPETVEMSQRELQRKKGAIWGRLIAMRVMGVRRPRFPGFALFRNWMKLRWTDKARSIFGTMRRIATRKYYRPL
jgi:coenzyme F420 hydrogenase subunit beta